MCHCPIPMVVFSKHLFSSSGRLGLKKLTLPLNLELANRNQLLCGPSSEKLLIVRICKMLISHLSFQVSNFWTAKVESRNKRSNNYDRKCAPSWRKSEDWDFRPTADENVGVPIYHIFTWWPPPSTLAIVAYQICSFWNSVLSVICVFRLQTL